MQGKQIKYVIDEYSVDRFSMNILSFASNPS